MINIKPPPKAQTIPATAIIKILARKESNKNVTSTKEKMVRPKIPHKEVEPQKLATNKSKVAPVKNKFMQAIMIFSMTTKVNVLFIYE